MKPVKLCILSVIVGALLTPISAHSQTFTDELLLKAFIQNPYRASAGHTPYEAPADFKESPVPKGYKAFYISHYGRHGSRYQSSEEGYRTICSVLDTLYSKGLLTHSGDSLRMELHEIWDAHKNQMCGMLTHKGAAEHRGIAERMYDRVPEVFCQESRDVVACRSTVVTRCVESMGNFSMAIKGKNPALDIVTNTDLLTGRTDGAPDPEEVWAFSNPARDAMLKVVGDMPTLASRLFVCPSQAIAFMPDRNPGHFFLELFEISAGAGCLDINVDPLRFFTPEELLAFNKVRNIHFTSSYGCFGPTRDISMRHAYPYARLLIEEADKAIAGNGHCADLRFAHDKQVGNILSLLDLENYNIYTPVDQSHNYQPAWKRLSMAVNLQIIFYRDRKSDILVKFLCNERETKIPSLNAVSGVYYRWSDVRKHILTRIKSEKPQL